MTTEYSAHPALASEQLKRAELANNCSNTAQTYHRRHISASSGSKSFFSTLTDALAAVTKSASKPAKITSNNTSKITATITKTSDIVSSTNDINTTDEPQKTLPDRTSFDDISHVRADNNVIGISFANLDDNDTKDCVDCAPTIPTVSIDEPDHLQHRFSRTQHQQQNSRQYFSQQRQNDIDKEKDNLNEIDDRDVCSSAIMATHISDGCLSDLSSIISSPAPSTVSSPLSTPTRLAPHFQQIHHNFCNHNQNNHNHNHNQKQYCCQKSTTADNVNVSGMGGNTTLSGTSLSHPIAASQHQQQQHQLQHNHHHHHHQHHHHLRHAHHHHQAKAASGCKKLQKFDPRLGPSPYRQLLPIALCILSFATVFSVLIVYMDTTEIRHQQFRLNMSRDYEFYGVAQDNPRLIEFLQQLHMPKNALHFVKNRDASNEPQQHFNFSGAHKNELTPEMAHYVADLVGGKMNGAVIQSLPGTLGHLMTAPWLAETLNWAGVIVEPEPRRFFTLRKQNAQRDRMQVLHACVSPNSYPKEVTIHNEDAEVRINSLLDEETSCFYSRVKCFPLYTIMLACNRVTYDLLSLGVHGHELEILQTLPFDKVQIEVISIHLHDEYFRNDMRIYIQSITKFLMGKSYKLQKQFGKNYFYQRINTTSRT